MLHLFLPFPLRVLTFPKVMFRLVFLGYVATWRGAGKAVLTKRLQQLVQYTALLPPASPAQRQAVL
ncbi:hypothetical protein OB13_01900 [Pontibacter sp. HJ8]